MIKIRKANSESEFRKITGYTGYLGLFFSENYQRYMTFRHGDNKVIVFLFSDIYVIPVLIRNYAIFHYAEFLESPRSYGSTNESEKSFLDATCAFMKKEFKVQCLLSTPVHSLFRTYPTGAKVIRFANTAIDLDKVEEKVFDALSYSFRKAVRRALKWNVECSIGGRELIADYAAMEATTWKRSGVSLNHSTDGFYDNLFKCMGDNIVVGVTYKEGKPQAGLVCYYDNNICYAEFGAHADEMEGGANNLLYWRMIQWCIKKGIKKFFIVGYRVKVDEDSKVARIQRFKDTFNAVHEEGFMFRVVFNPKMCDLYSIIMKTVVFFRTKKWPKHTPDLIEQEIHKWPEYND